MSQLKVHRQVHIKKQECGREKWRNITPSPPRARITPRSLQIKNKALSMSNITITLNIQKQAFDSPTSLSHITQLSHHHRSNQELDLLFGRHEHQQLINSKN